MINNLSLSSEFLKSGKDNSVLRFVFFYLIPLQIMYAGEHLVQSEAGSAREVAKS